MRVVVLLVLAASIFAGCGVQKDQDSIDPALLGELQSHVSENGLPPIEYVVSKFTDHDVVVLGEQHRIRHDVELVQNVIPALYANGVYILATEFARAEDQYLIDSLLAGAEYDEGLARQIQFNQFVAWAYQEYLDIFKSAWAMNRMIDEGAPAFRILGMNCSPDWSIIKTPADREKDELKKQVWNGCGEADWAEVVLEEVRAGRKVLVHCGIHHGFTEYLQPVVNHGEFVRYVENRAGRHIFNEIGKKSFTIYSHAPFNDATGYGGGYVRPMGGAIDQVMESSGTSAGPVAFDVNGSPFSKLTANDCVYSHGYEEFSIDDFCDGYIYTRPFAEYEGMTCIEDFVTEANLEQAQQQCPNPWYRTASREAIQESFCESAVEFVSIVREL